MKRIHISSFRDSLSYKLYGEKYEQNNGKCDIFHVFQYLLQKLGLQLKIFYAQVKPTAIAFL